MLRATVLVKFSTLANPSLLSLVEVGFSCLLPSFSFLLARFILPLSTLSNSDSGFVSFLLGLTATEALYCDPDKDVVYLKKRFGFVKLALETGASLVPVFSFNECNTYSIFGINNPFISGLKKKFQSVFGISLPLIKNVIPRKCNVTVVIGAPLAVPKIENPSKEEVARYLDLYIEALTKLYDENRAKYNTPATKPPLTVL
eukprot:m.221396 g.221396  ORF g.221396 m.221396 type:complete len:201 (+) comp54164_c0_seq12:871-1473(+)